MRWYSKIPQRWEKVASSFFQHEAALQGVGRLLLLLHLNISISRWQSLASPSVPTVETNQVEIPDSVAACVLLSSLPRARLDAHGSPHKKKFPCRINSCFQCLWLSRRERQRHCQVSTETYHFAAGGLMSFVSCDPTRWIWWKRAKTREGYKNCICEGNVCPVSGDAPVLSVWKYIRTTKVPQCCHKLLTFQITGLPSSEWQEAITTVIIGTRMPITGASLCHSKNSTTLEWGNIFIKCVTLRMLQSDAWKHVALIKPALFKVPKQNVIPWSYGEI